MPHHLTNLDELGEEEITEPGELLYRQITPSILCDKDGTPASHAFGPSTADQGKPSYSRESKVTPQEAFDWHNLHARSESVGVWGCTVAEVHTANLRAVDDSGVASNTSMAPGHCFVDFRGLTKQEIRNRRAVLFRAALKRGILYPSAGTEAINLN